VADRDLHSVPLADLAAAAAGMTPSQKGAPTDERGVPGSSVIGGIAALGGPPGWGTFMDDREYAVELQWPQSTEAYERMETDAQLKGLMLATTLPIRRFRWELDPNEADPGVVEHVAEAFNLPIRGEDPRPPRRGGINHDRHMGHALRALSQGHYHFERVYEYREDGLLHLKKLATRPPRSITGIRVDEHGDLLAIEQLATGGFASGRIVGGAFEGMGNRVLEVARLLTYLWDTADDGDQVGRSMLRACYRDWLVKDALIRVDAVKHERNGMGIPWFEVDPAASKPQIDSLAKRAEEIRASSIGGGAGPGRLRIAGTEGTLPDTVGSIRYHDEQMSKAFMLLLFNLGGDAASGARALGDTFKDWYLDMQGAIADWYAEGTQAQIDDEVRVNWGPDEQSPLLTYTRVESAELAFSDLVEGVAKGVIAVPPAFRAYVEERFKVPGQAEAATEAPAAPPPNPEPEPEPEPPKAAERSQPKRSRLAEDMLVSLGAKGAQKWPALAREVGTDPKNGTARRARDLLLSEGAIVKHPANGTLALVAELALPDRDLKRQPLPFEVAAGMNLADMEETFMQGREDLITIYREAQEGQIAELAAEVEEAGGDMRALGAVACDPVDPDVLFPRLMEIAEAGVASARAEHDAQLGGPAAKAPFRGAEPDTEALEGVVRERAEAASMTLASGLSFSAAKKATSVSELDPEAAATLVRDHLDSLSDAALTEQLGGATQQAYNSGRRAYMRAAGPKEVWASEILDQNVCSACNGVDGTTWQTLAEAEVAYPIGGYVECEGGLRCRGTLVAVY